ncbi:DUF2834 domain-containing protein [uncultured Paraglaciecola sp.]|uniref:DUF2834 domain-containing protein n=1 Tax=uncultured Paraglaciecola sp. TaxID=1765024 RepID=UPI002597B94C|nr:DUF2834 domain-containing protein [uncultured Paraglaciecola sp.]
MRNVYLLLAILGGVIPYLYFFQFIQLEGLNIPLFVESLFVNGAAGGFSADLLISSFVFWLFMFKESKHSSNPKPFLFIAINLTVGLSCALPAYLYAKSAAKN